MSHPGRLISSHANDELQKTAFHYMNEHIEDHLHPPTNRKFTCLVSVQTPGSIFEKIREGRHDPGWTCGLTYEVHFVFNTGTTVKQTIQQSKSFKMLLEN